MYVWLVVGMGTKETQTLLTFAQAVAPLADLQSSVRGIPSNGGLSDLHLV